MPETDRKKGRKVASKMCVKCGKIQTLDQFYMHKDWAAQSYRDAWCKECAGKCCVDRDGTREYFWYNNRRWTDSCWEMAMKKATYSLANDADYLRAREEKKQSMADAMCGRYIFSVMNLASVYKFNANIDTEGAFREFDRDAPSARNSPAETASDDENGELIFNREWNGMYTQ